MTIELDGLEMTTRAALHDHVAKQLGFPESYGRNLDALHDLLTDRGKTVLVLRHSGAMEESLGGYAQAFLRVLRQAAGENSNLTVKIQA